MSDLFITVITVMAATGTLAGVFVTLFVSLRKLRNETMAAALNALQEAYDRETLRRRETETRLSALEDALARETQARREAEGKIVMLEAKLAAEVMQRRKLQARLEDTGPVK